MKWLAALALFRTVLCAPYMYGHTAEENMRIHDRNLFEGDIRLTMEQFYNIEHGLDVDSSRKRGSIARDSLWPNGVVPYEIHSSLRGNSDAERAIKQGIEEWTSKTCLRIRKRNGESDYIVFGYWDGCWSYIGRIRGPQRISLSNGCWQKGTVAHEIAHALGFYHEQSRPDRDDYVVIKWENIRAGVESNFQKYTRSQIDSLGTPYDYDSVMHYGEKAFSKNNRPTIVVKQQGKKIGQRSGLSSIDAEQARLLYQCSPVKETTTLPPTTTRRPKTTKAPTVVCRDSFPERLCNIIKTWFNCNINVAYTSCKKTCQQC